MKFQEFPWGSRALGFVSLFDSAPTSFYFRGSEAMVREDQSGVNFIRSAAYEKVRSNLITTVRQPIGPRTLVIAEGAPPLVPVQLPGGSFDVVLRGQGFGENPVVALTDFDVEVISATDTEIDVRLRNITGVAPEGPLVVRVVNPVTGDEAARTGLFRLTGGDTAAAPQITSVTPGAGTEATFPVTINGTNFDMDGGVEVLFGTVRMPVISGGSNSIRVGFPLSGISKVGPVDVTVINTDSVREDTALNAFEFLADPSSKPVGTAGCAAGGAGASGSPWGDAAVVLAVFALLAWAQRRRGGATQEE